jgi:ribosomal protein S18 acetylase RimI-like enzyme
MTATDAGIPSTSTPDCTAVFADISDPRLRGDARILREALLKSVITSPAAFLATFEDVRNRRPSYWQNELHRSTYAIVQQGSAVVGVAASKRIYDKRDLKYADNRSARFIESVWIDPSFRRLGLGGRLVKYLIEQERAENPEIQHFYLWVFRDNVPAILLYEQMGFKPTDRQGRFPKEVQFEQGRIRKEVQYELMFDSSEPDEDELTADKAERDRDWKNHGLRYRVLIGEDS